MACSSLSKALLSESQWGGCASYSELGNKLETLLCLKDVNSSLATGFCWEIW